MGQSNSEPIVLYTNPPSRGRMVRWMLEQLGEPYQVEVLDYATSMKAPAYRAINPRGRVLALRHGSTAVTEVAASAYLADAFPQARLAPPPADALRGPYYRWLFFAAGPLEAAISNKGFGMQVESLDRRPAFERYWSPLSARRAKQRADQLDDAPIEQHSAAN